jgi:hypothetical protein
VAADIEAEASIPGRLGDATDLVPGFENRDMGTALTQEIGGGEPGRSSTDHDDALATQGHGSMWTRLLQYPTLMRLARGMADRHALRPQRRSR